MSNSKTCFRCIASGKERFLNLFPSTLYYLFVSVALKSWCEGKGVWLLGGCETLDVSTSQLHFFSSFSFHLYQIYMSFLSL